MSTKYHTFTKGGQTYKAISTKVSERILNSRNKFSKDMVEKAILKAETNDF